jgi:hypothetical protein
MRCLRCFFLKEYNSYAFHILESVKRAIGEPFRMTDFGEAKCNLGMEIVKNRKA